MGICLDTEQSDGSQAFEDDRDSWATPRGGKNEVMSSAGQLPLHNSTNVQFESPKVPVIFVLGGPGSGKVTHCDNLMQEKKGITHINMTDLLQQYAVGNDMQDFGLLSSKTVTEVLMLEMKMAPNAKTYLVSGFPRNMRDVVEYSEKIHVVNGVILISWRQKVLEKQIDYGAKLGQVVLSLAKMELNNFYKNVMPVAEYFDQSSMLVSVNGERHPAEVYKDFKDAVIKILGMQDNPPALGNGREAAVPVDITSELPTMTNVPAQVQPSNPRLPERMVDTPRPGTRVISVTPHHPARSSPRKGEWPPVLWVIGGPGSNKASLCAQAARETGWTHVSLGKLLRAAAEVPLTKHSRETEVIRENIAAGEMAPLAIVMKFIEQQMVDNKDAEGIILDGFPRDMTQVTEFEAKFKQKPSIILLDCSKLQLGRGRLDDSVTAFRRRLEIFRQLSLPMLKTMDNIGRLTIVDGDTDTAPVQEDFKGVVKEHIEYIKSSENEPPIAHPDTNVPNGRGPPTVGNGVAKTVANGVNHMANGVTHMINGYGPVKAPAMGNGAVPQKYTNLQETSNGYSEVNFMDGHI